MYDHENFFEKWYKEKKKYIQTHCTTGWPRFGKESSRSSSNEWTKSLYQDYLHCIPNFCRALLSIFSKQFISSNTKCRKRMLNFVWNTWEFWWNETDDEILPVFPQNLWTLKFIFSRSRRKLFLVLFQAIIYVFSFKKNVKMTVKYLKLLWYKFLSTKTWNCSIFYRISSKMCFSCSYSDWKQKLSKAKFNVFDPNKPCSWGLARNCGYHWQEKLV